MEGAVQQRTLLGQRARRDVPTSRLDEQVGEIALRARAADWNQAAVINEANVLLGWLDEDQLNSNPEARAEDAMLEGPVTFRPSMALDETARWMDDNGITSVLVTSSDGTLMGVAKREDLGSVG